MANGSNVDFPSNGHRASGYLSLPDGGRGPGVVVIQEWWGLVDHIRDVCDRLAAEGFVALAPDLYHGETTSEPDEAGKLMMELDIETAAKDMGGAVDYLLGHDAVEGDQVGAIGFCMGGALVLVLAARNGDKVGAVSPFYSAFAGEVPDLSGISAPVLGHFGENDASLHRKKRANWKRPSAETPASNAPSTSTTEQTTRLSTMTAPRRITPNTPRGRGK